MGDGDVVDPQSLGEALRRAREQRGLTVQQIAATTRIPARHLEALERNDIGSVPGGMYLRAEIRTYADAVGLSRHVALGYLQAAADPPAAPPAPPPVVPAARHPGLSRAVIIGVCLGIATLVFLRPTRDASVSARSGLAGEADTVRSVPEERPAVQQATAAPAPAAAAETPSPEIPRPLASDTAPPTATSGTSGSAPDVALANAVTVVDPQPVAPVVTPAIEIVTEPAGAHVTIDGVGWGVTPVTIPYLPPGNKRLRVTRDGFSADERVIRVAPDQPQTTVRIELHPAD